MTEEERARIIEEMRGRGFTQADIDRYFDKGISGGGSAGRVVAGLLGGGLETAFLGRRQRRKAQKARRNELYNAFWSDLSPKERREKYYDADFNANPDAIREEVELYAKTLEAMGMSPDDIAGELGKFEERLQDEIRAYRNSPEGQTDFALEQFDVLADEMEGKAVSADELRGSYEDFINLDDSRAFLQGAGQMSQTFADGDFIDAQKRALGDLQNVVSSEGMTDADKAAMDLARMQSAQAESARQKGLEQQFAARGMGGGGSEMAMQMMGGQGLSQQLAMQNAASQVAARQRALQAMQASGQLAGQGRGQSFQEASFRNQATDDRERQNVDYYRNYSQNLAQNARGSLIDAFNMAGQSAAFRSDAANTRLGAYGTREAREAAAAQAAKDRRANAVTSAIGTAAGAAGSITG